METRQSAARVPLRVLPSTFEQRLAAAGWSLFMKDGPGREEEEEEAAAAVEAAAVRGEVTEESGSRLKAKRGGDKRKCRLNPASGPITSARLVVMQSGSDVKFKPSSSSVLWRARARESGGGRRGVPKLWSGAIQGCKEEQPNPTVYYSADVIQIYSYYAPPR